MKIRNIQQAVLLTALATAAAVAVALLLELRLLAIPIAAVVVIIVGRYLFNSYVTFRLKPIYQIFSARNSSSKEIAQRYKGSDMATAVEGDLQAWAERSSSEIARLRENEIYRKEFVGNVSHELKTPLCSIQGYILTLLDGGMDDPAINRKYLEQTQKNIDRLINIVSDLEDISRLEAGTLELNRQRFDLLQLVGELIESIDIQAQTQNIRVEAEHRVGTPIMVYADRIRISQVIINLLSNSIKYGISGGVTRIRFIDMFDKVMVEIQDNGIGIAPEQLPRIFERFYRVDKSRSRQVGGTGLGLSIVKHILEAHHETITVRSSPGAGTTFSFTIAK